nr:MFS transporter [uncultured Sphingomonas sp.]
MTTAAARTADRAAPIWTLVMSVAASSLSFIDGSILNVALPTIRDGTGANAAEVQWVINAYTLPLAALILLGGALGDRQGRRRWLVIGTVLFGVASILCALSRTIEPLLIGRVLQGLGAALLLPNSLALLHDAYEGEARGSAVGIWAAAGAIAAAIAPLLGGWLVDHAGWPSIFWVNVPLVIVAIAIAVTKVPESTIRTSGKLDHWGALLATACLAALSYGLTRWSSAGHADGISIITVLAGAALLVAFILAERRLGDGAMIPLTMFSNRCFSALNLMTFLLYGAFGAATMLIPYILINVGGYSPVAAGMSLLPLSILLGVASPMMGKIAERTGPLWPLTIGPMLVAVGIWLETRLSQGQNYWTDAFPGILVLSIGMAAAVAPLTNAVLSSVDDRHTGMASGFNSAMSRTGSLIAVAALGPVFAQQGAALLPPFTVAMQIFAAVCVAAGLSSYFGLRGGVTLRR